MHTGVRVQRGNEKSVACAKKLRIHNILIEFIWTKQQFLFQLSVFSDFPAEICHKSTLLLHQFLLYFEIFH